MPEFVTCPVCGCKVQMPESMFGKRVRCFGCDQRFVADPGTNQAAPPPRREPTAPPDANFPPLAPRVGARPGVYDVEADGPFCPDCGRPVAWKQRYCPHCGEEFEERDDFQPGTRLRRRFRRDTIPHRGPLLTTLANISLAAGALSLCLFGTGAVVGIPLGIAVWVMAQMDLQQMRAGVMDARGRPMTETARAHAITGLVLSLLFAAGSAALFLTTL